MDSQMHDDEREGGDELVFQDLTPEQPATRVQQKIIRIQQNWPPRWKKRYLLIPLTVLSGILIFFLIIEPMLTSTQPAGTVNVSASGNAIITTSVAQVLSYQNVLYVIATQLSSNTGTLEALNARTGTLIWIYAHHNTQEITLAGNILYIRSDTNIVAFNAINRTQLWQTQTSSSGDKWQIAQGILFTTSAKGMLEALNAETGKLLWQTNRSSSQWQVDNGIYYITPPTNLGLTALDARTGKLLWHNTHLYQDLTLDNGKFYLQNDIQQSIEAYNGKNGTLLWQFPTHGQNLALSAYNGFLVLSDVEAIQVEVLNDQTGKLLWQRQGSVYFSVANPDQAVLSSRQKNETDIVRMADGTVLSHFPRADALISIEDGIAFFLYYPQNDSTQSGGNKFFIINIEAVRISDGNTLWIRQTREEFPQPQNNTIGIVPINDNMLILLRVDTGQTVWQYKLDRAEN